MPFLQWSHMYTPKHYREEDRQKIVAFMHQNEFATLVAYDGKRSIAGHFLMEVVSDDDEAIYINGHMSKANPLWKSFERNPKVLVIFQGAHTYISPTWYNHVNVPTWNYISVHAYGNPRIISDHAEYQAMLQRLVSKQETGSNPHSEYRLETLPQDIVMGQMKGTVGFQIKVTQLDANFKLSQNRDDEDYQNIIIELEKRLDDLSHGVANAMRDNRPEKTDLSLRETK